MDQFLLLDRKHKMTVFQPLFNGFFFFKKTTPNRKSTLFPSISYIPFHRFVAVIDLNPLPSHTLYPHLLALSPPQNWHDRKSLDFNNKMCCWYFIEICEGDFQTALLQRSWPFQQRLTAEELLGTWSSRLPPTDRETLSGLFLNLNSFI